ncbi:hypothetical protein ZONE111905_09275 [Zobellia nedashkovskayae]
MQNKVLKINMKLTIVKRKNFNTFRENIYDHGSIYGQVQHIYLL